MRELPRAVDLRESLLGRAPVRDQGPLQSCSAHAVAAALACEVAFEPSRLFIHYNCRDGPPLVRHCVAAVAQHGFCSEEEWPYDAYRFGKRPPDSVYARAAAFRGCAARELDQDLRAFKQCLSDGRPIVCGLILHYGFLGAAVRSTGAIPLPGPTEPRLGGHAVAVTGYDEARERFLIRNSMGAAWGEEGYGYIPYAYMADPHLAVDFWALESPKTEIRE
jgi:C1A family cysteine protease